MRDQTAHRVESLVNDMLLMRAQNKHKESTVRRLLTRQATHGGQLSPLQPGPLMRG